MKKFSGDELEEIEAIKSQGEYHYTKVSSKIDDQDMRDIQTTFERLREKTANKGKSR